MVDTNEEIARGDEPILCTACEKNLSTDADERIDAFCEHCNDGPFCASCLLDHEGECTENPANQENTEDE